MTRQECEAKIMELMRQIEAVYNEYNPGNTKGLSICIGSENSGAFNEYWEGGADENKPINVGYFSDGTIKTCGKYIWPEVDNDAE